MSDAALEFAEERGLGSVLSRVRLDSGLSVAGGSRARAHLLLTDTGLWLVAARDRFRGQHLDLLTRSDLRLVAGSIRDRLCYGQETLTIPAGRRGAVERLIALARFSSSSEPARPPLSRSLLVRPRDDLTEAWLKSELSADEVLLVWLVAENLVTVRSNLIGETRCPLHLLVTDRRAALVAWSAVGDVSYVRLEANTTEARTEGERTTLTSASEKFVSRRGDEQASRSASALLSLPPGGARLLEAARRSWLASEQGKTNVGVSLSLLDAATEQHSPHARYARLLASAELGDGRAVDASALARALETRIGPAEVGDLWLAFRFSDEAGSALVRALLDRGSLALPFAFALQRRIYGAPSADPEVAKDELRLSRFAVETRLASSAEPDPRDIALLSVLSAHGLSQTASVPAISSRALPDELISSTLTHPLARGQNSLVANAEKLIALSPEPDHAALSDYCEALDHQQHPAAKRALDAACSTFGVPNVRAYVSRGKKSIGMRGYEGQTPYILLGAAHLDRNSPFFMTESELAFALGAETLHLKLGQARLTSSEVWAGAFARTKSGVELALGLLPLLRGVPLATSITKFLDKIPEPALRRGFSALVRFERSKRPTSTEPTAISHINENLMTAHRLMQMSADRAGLLLCGDLRSSLRGLLLLRPDTRPLLDAMVENDVVSALLDCQLEAALLRDLLGRTAALLHFFASDEYLTLRRAFHAS